MKINYKIVGGILAAVLIYDGVVATRNHKKFNAMKNRCTILIETNRYLSSKLDEYDVPFDDFDEIILKNIFLA